MKTEINDEKQDGLQEKKQDLTAGSEPTPNEDGADRGGGIPYAFLLWLVFFLILFLKALLD